MNPTPSANKNLLMVLGAIVVLALFVLVFLLGRSTASPTTTETVNDAGASTVAAQNGTTTGATNDTDLAANGTAQQPVVAHTAPAPAAPQIAFIAPIANVSWAIGTQNVIAWNHAGDVSGELTLVNATTKKVVGVILGAVGSQQTSYTWSTRFVSLSRTNPGEVAVLPGTYMIVISYDGNRIVPATSQVFTITGAGQ